MFVTLIAFSLPIDPTAGGHLQGQKMILRDKKTISQDKKLYRRTYVCMSCILFPVCSYPCVYPYPHFIPISTESELISMPDLFVTSRQQVASFGFRRCSKIFRISSIFSALNEAKTMFNMLGFY